MLPTDDLSLAGPLQEDVDLAHRVAVRDGLGAHLGEDAHHPRRPHDLRHRITGDDRLDYVPGLIKTQLGEDLSRHGRPHVRHWSQDFTWHGRHQMCCQTNLLRQASR